MSTSPNKPKVLISTRLPEDLFQKISQECEITEYWNNEENMPREKLLKGVENVDGLCCTLESKKNFF